MDAGMVVAVLREEKDAGVAFEAAWVLAIARCHVSRRDTDAGVQRSLLDDPVENQVEFLKRACADAWHGRRPALAGLHAAMDLVAAPDESTFASRTRTMAAA